MKKNLLVGVLGPSDAGKTAMCEKLAGPIKKFAREQKTGVTLKTGYGQFQGVGFRGYILDNPGHEALSVEAIRNIDLLDVAIYVVDGALERKSAPYQRGLDHYRSTRLLLTNLGVPCILCINKADTRSREQIVAIYEDYRKRDECVPIIPTSTRMAQGLSLLYERLQSLEPRVIEAPDPVRARVLKSFNINPSGVPLKEVRGGILGCYRYGLLEGNLSHGNTFSQRLTQLRIVRTSEHTDRIVTIETLMDPSLAKNDYQKGTLILNYTGDQLIPPASLHLKPVYTQKTLTRGDHALLVVLGQALPIVIRKTGPCLEVSREKVRDWCYLPPGAKAIVLTGQGRALRVGGLFTILPPRES